MIKFIDRFMRSASGKRLVIDWRKVKLETEITKDIDLFTKEPIYLFTATVYSVRNKIVTKAYKEFTQNKDGLKKAKDWENRFNKMIQDGTWL